MKNRPPFIADLLFVWNHIQERFHALQEHNSSFPEKTEDEREEAEKQFAHLRCILLLILAKMLRILNEATKEKQIVNNDLKRLVFINDEKNQLLIHMACQDLGELLSEKQCRGRGKRVYCSYYIFISYSFHWRFNWKIS